ncbi:MAG TPA: translation elongation factor Ts [Longimicrobiales bacterium]|nr:translation elongation factor Ts [Longimicrobiales bacterium]
MTTITAGTVKELRERTGAGMMECKKALEETGGDIEAAIDVLRAKGAAKAAKRAGKEATEGAIGSYVHMGGRIGVLIEVACETDFVARTDDFQQLVRDLAMHIAASNPLGVSEADVAPEVVERERSVFLEQVKNEGKPEAMHDKIVDGKIKRFFKESTLMAQPFVKDPERTIEQLVTDVSAKTGERIVIRRFARFELGA